MVTASGLCAFFAHGVLLMENRRARIAADGLAVTPATLDIAFNIFEAKSLFKFPRGGAAW